MSQHYARTPALYGRSRARRITPWLIGATVVVVVGIAGCFAGATFLDSSAKSATDNTKAQQAQATADVKLTACGVDNGTGWPKATLTITNHGQAKASYLVTVVFQSHDGATQYDSAPTTVQALAPSQKATVVAEGLATAPRTFTCQVGSVNRM